MSWASWEETILFVYLCKDRGVGLAMNAITSSLRSANDMVYQKRRYLELITKCLYFLLYHP